MTKSKTIADTESTNKVEKTVTNPKKVKATKKNEQTAKEKNLSFTKKFVLFVVINAEIQIYLSYLLGFLGRDNIAESLSIQVVVTVLGSIGFYCIKALIENMSKYGMGFIKKKETSENEDTYN